MQLLKKIQSFYPTLGMSWATVAMLFVGMLIATYATALITGILGEVVAPSWLFLIAYILPFAVVAAFIYLLQHNEPIEENRPATPHLSPVLFLVLLALTPALGLVIEPLTDWLPMPRWVKELFSTLSQNDLPTFLMVAIAAPLCEEWLCRGVIAKGLLRHSTPAKAILWSAFIFALIHGNPWQAVPAFVIGLLLGYVYWKTRSLLPCIFIHFVNNGLSFLLLLLYPTLNADSTTHDLLGSHYWEVYFLAVMVVAGAVWALRRRFSVSS